MSLLARDDSAGAEKMMERTLELNRDYGPALAVLARILDGGGRRDEALEYYERAQEAMPENAELLTDYGSCLLEMGRAGEAVQVLESGLQAAKTQQQADLVSSIEQALSKAKARDSAE